MAKGKAPKAPPPPPAPPPPVEAVDATAQQGVAKDSRKRASGAKKAWLTKGQSLGGGTNLKQG